MIHRRKAFEQHEIEALSACLPETDIDNGDVHNTGDWLTCIKVEWHTDMQVPTRWSALLLISGVLTVQTVDRRDNLAEMVPGDLAILNIHREHRGYSPQLEVAFCLCCDFDTKPTVNTALAAMRGTRAYRAAMALPVSQELRALANEPRGPSDQCRTVPDALIDPAPITDIGLNATD